MSDYLKELSSEFSENLKLNYDLKKKNWFNIGGKTKIFYKAKNLKELKDLAKLPKINIPAYNRAVKKFALQGGKFGVPFVIGAGGIDFLKKQGIGFDQEFEQTADLIMFLHRPEDYEASDEFSNISRTVC